MISIDREAMQKVQDAFCLANHVYCQCVGRNMVPITEFSGTSQEREFVEQNFPWDARQMLCYSFSDGVGEDVIEHVFLQDYLMARGIAVRGEGGELLGVWLVFGLDGERLPEDVYIPAEIRRIGAEDFEASVRLLDMLIGYYFAEKARSSALRTDISKAEETGRHMAGDLQKREVLTEMMTLLASEGGFFGTVEEALRMAGGFLKISECVLIDAAPDNAAVSVVAGWAREDTHSLRDVISGAQRETLPFLTERPYTVSSGVALPDAFAKFMEDYCVEAGVFLPLNIDEKPGMYLIFAMTGQKRKWSVEELRFMNDVKGAVHTTLVQRLARRSLERSCAVMGEILEHVNCGVCVTDVFSGETLYANGMFGAITQNPEDKRRLERLLQNPKVPADEALECHLTDSDCWYQVSFAEISWMDERQARMCVLHDITKSRQRREQMERQTKIDFLTGLQNRMSCEADIRQEIRMALRSGNQGAVICLDLDDFKLINDALGHRNGDVLLREMAGVLTAVRGVGQHCYRIGGDEFVILVTHENFSYLESIVRQLMNIFSKPWLLDGREYYCTVSAGVATFPKDGTDMETLLQRADLALYEAKRKGKQRAEHYSEAIPQLSKRRLDLEKSLRRAVEQGCKEFQIYYQPLIDVTKPDKPCCGAEALLRWDSPEWGIVMPSEFVPLTEYLGLIVPIGEHVLMEACARCKYWNDFGHPEYRINVNLSVVQLLQNDIVDVVRRALETSEINPNNLTLEVTEGLAINNLERMRTVLGEIKALGVRLALDDFGTGYSSLNHIRSLPIDVVKIDRCFVSDMGEDDFSDAFVRTMSELADTLDLHVCVEGVEQEHQQDTLSGLKVNMIQGFLYDEPLPVKEFEEKYLF